MGSLPQLSRITPSFNDESKGLWRRPQKNMCRFLSCSGMSEQKISSFFHFHYTVFGRSIVVTRILKYAQPKNNMSSQILKRGHFNGKIVLSNLRPFRKHLSFQWSNIGSHTRNSHERPDVGFALKGISFPKTKAKGSEKSILGLNIILFSKSLGVHRSSTFYLPPFKNRYPKQTQLHITVQEGPNKLNKFCVESSGT